MEDFSRLEVGQAKFLVKLINSPTEWITSNGKSEGATARILFRKGWIRPFGVEDRRVRWKLNREFSKTEKAYLKELAE